MQHTITETLTLVTEQCCNCGVPFAIPSYLRAERLYDGKPFCCPNGHTQRFTENREKQLRELQAQVEQKQRELTAARCETLAEKQKREAVEKEHRRHLTRTKNGVCPCCQRSFQDLRRHLATKHPEYQAK